MIHYVLGHSGAGKTRYCLQVFEHIDKAVFFASFSEYLYDWEEKSMKKFSVQNLTDEITEKSLVNLLPSYRQHLDRRMEFANLLWEKIMEIKERGCKTMFLDEFQFLCTSKMVDFILDNKEKIDFWIIHQYPGQLEASFFNVLYAEARQKYLLDPYPEEDGYNFKL